MFDFVKKKIITKTITRLWEKDEIDTAPLLDTNTLPF